jgi:hypothetical protein
LSAEKILNNISNLFFSNIIGCKVVPPVIHMGNASKSIRFALPAANNQMDALLKAEFVRYAVQKELFTFVCFTTRAMTIEPDKMADLTESEIAKLKTPDAILAHPHGIEVIQFYLEMDDDVHFRSYKISRGPGNIILNMTELKDLTRTCKLKDIEVSGQMNNFFGGLKTTLLSDNPAMIDDFNRSLSDLFNAKAPSSENQTKH